VLADLYPAVGLLTVSPEVDRTARAKSPRLLVA
jgi:hypothetical protein